MKPALTALLRCPACRGSLHLKAASWKDGEIVSGQLRCRACNREWSVNDGLPSLLHHTSGLERTADAFGSQWEFFSADEENRCTLYGKTEAEELDVFKRAFSDLDFANLEAIILDAGCGSGRLTRSIALASPRSSVIGIDLSRSARQAQRLAAGIPNMHVVRANILALPFAEGAFDVVWSEGVLHHLPDTFEGLRSLDRHLRPGGAMYIWVYERHRFSVLGALRRLLVRPSHLPHTVRKAIAWLLAGPLYVGFEAGYLLGRFSRRHDFEDVVFAVYDNISPEYQHRHTSREIVGWFEKLRYSRIHCVKRTGMSATKGGVTRGEARSSAE